MAKKRQSKEEPEISKSVDQKTGIKLLQKQIEKAEALLSERPIISSDHSAWENTTKDYLVKTFGSTSSNVGAVIHASSDLSLRMGMGTAEVEKYRASRLRNQVKMLRSCIEQLETDIEISGSYEIIDEKSLSKVSINKVFIVHGRDEAAKESVSRFIEKLGLQVIILHEQPNKGRTIIEKFEEYSDVGYAVVLLTPDDKGSPKDEPNCIKLRARQNVIFELGFFIGKLGRDKVCALYKEDIEIPTDISGLLYVPMDSGNGWKLSLAKEIKQAGLNVDLNRAV